MVDSNQIGVMWERRETSSFDPREPYRHENGWVFSLQYPDTVADKLVEELYPLGDAPGSLRYVNGAWYSLGEANVWRPRSEGEISAAVKRWMRAQWAMRKDGPSPMPTGVRVQQDVIAALRDAASAEVEIEVPTATWAVDLADGRWLVDSSSPDRRSLEYIPEEFIVRTLPFTREQLRAAAVPTRWWKFLRDGFSESDIVLLQEFFGYCLTGSTEFDKFLWIQGVGGSGKTTCLSILERMLGGIEGGNVAVMDNDSLSHFNAEVEGKRLLSFGDYRAGRNDAAMVKLCLAVAGGQNLRIERKRVDAYSAPCAAKIAVTSNDWFFVQDTSGAIPRRLIPVVRRKPTDMVENAKLEEELAEELPGIMLWAIEGLQRLNANGGFSTELIDKTILETVTTTTDPMIAFIATRVVLDPTAKLDKADFMSLWREYAKAKNIFSHTLDAMVHRMTMAAEHHFGAKVYVKGHTYIYGVRAKTATELLEAKDEL